MRPRAERPPAATREPSKEPAKEPPKEPSKEKEKEATRDRESFYLQAGAFQSASDADGLKGRLALIGVEASVQAAEIPDKGVWHRVRLGPYHHPDEVERVRGILRQNGMDAALIKVRDPG
jgi:cell division protein FtsN